MTLAIRKALSPEPLPLGWLSTLIDDDGEATALYQEHLDHHNAQSKPATDEDLN